MKVILWGLKNGNDSFKHIYTGFQDNFLHRGNELIWVTDHPSSVSAIDSGDLVIATDRQYSNLKLKAGAKYFTLNLDKTQGVGKQLWEYENSYYMQEFTADAFGSPDSQGSICLFAQNIRTLFLPWGTPVFQENFDSFNVKRQENQDEYFVGSIWDNPEGQGNKTKLREYSRVLEEFGVSFKRIGGNRWGRKGVSEFKSRDYVRKSRLGAAIVGNWQAQNSYYPCRLFKAVSSGMPPISNLDATRIFGDSLLFNPDVKVLTKMSLSEKPTDALARLTAASEIVRDHYTYSAMISRILRVTNGEW